MWFLDDRDFEWIVAQPALNPGISFDKGVIYAGGKPVGSYVHFSDSDARIALAGDLAAFGLRVQSAGMAAWAASGAMGGFEMALAVGARAAKAGVTVYRSLNAGGQVQYVGITSNLARRAAQHLRLKGIQIEKVLSGLSPSDARAVEQALIEVHGLGRNGGTLALNKTNSIAKTNLNYAAQVKRGLELLTKAGYR